MKRFLSKIKQVKSKDIIGLLLFLIVLIPALIKKAYLKIIKKELWLICEQENTAHDKKVQKYGNIINWSSLKHYYYYLSATQNISSHKEGNPNHSLFTMLHIYLNLFNNRVFLQHGVLYQDFEMFHWKNSKFKIFIAGAKPEYDFLKKNYGYRNNEIKYTGLARFDNLHNYEIDNKIILLIPTWRRWLNTKEEFKNSEYYKKLMSLINNNQLANILEDNDKELYFYPHISTQKFINLYKTDNKRIKILSSNDIDIQELLKKGALLITDYSSIFTDFAYMNKPIIYYQHDKSEFFNKHYSNYKKGYFNFEKDGFGKVVDNETELISILNYYIKNNFENEKEYENKIKNFFLLNDKNNCKRIYEAILEEKNAK